MGYIYHNPIREKEHSYPALHLFTRRECILNVEYGSKRGKISRFQPDICYSVFFHQQIFPFYLKRTESNYLSSTTINIQGLCLLFVWQNIVVPNLKMIKMILLFLAATWSLLLLKPRQRAFKFEVTRDLNFPQFLTQLGTIYFRRHSDFPFINAFPYSLVSLRKFSCIYNMKQLQILFYILLMLNFICCVIQGLFGK